jgi:phosphatidylglycerophosphate synthase
MNEKIYQSMKSVETEDWLDLHVIRPLCYYCAKGFAYFDIHPNTVTSLSMFIGAGSCVFFAHGSYYYEGAIGLALNLLAILLLMVADILDCTDGQLARMTGKKSKVGRILDGLAGFVWFTPIYLGMAWRFYQHHSLEFGWLGISDTPQNALIATTVVFVLGLMSGFLGIAAQQRLADYYIQVHLFFLKGEKGSELDSSVRQQEIYDQMDEKTPKYERIFQKSYIDYTKKQEDVTPQFQRLMKSIREKYGSSDQLPQNIREEIHRESLALMPWNGLLTFNFRSFWLFVFILIDLPAEFFIFEIFAMGLLTEYVRRRHEGFCSRIADKL